MQNLTLWWARAPGQSLAGLALAVFGMVSSLTKSMEVMRAADHIVCTAVAAVISCRLIPMEEYLLLMDQCLLRESVPAPDSYAERRLQQLGLHINSKFWEFCHSGACLCACVQ